MEGTSRMASGGSSGGEVSERQKYDDEKRRITDSCFSKTDETGAVLESYITHLKIIEDSAYPSTPPPPNLGTNSKKVRTVIIAVRKSGRVRLHKARENGNKSFSIGKTWQMDDLTAVRSYTSPEQGTPEEEEQKRWAGDMGFTVTLGKDYYWQANAQPEKQFFIASLVKIFLKYTGGRLPILVGFNEKEMGALVGSQGRNRPIAQPNPPSGPIPQPPYGQSQNRTPLRSPSRDPAVRQQASRDPMQRPSGGTSSFTSQSSRPQDRIRREDSPSGSIESQGAVPPPSNLRRVAGSNQSQDSFGTRSDDANSIPPRSRSGMNGTPNVPGRFPERSLTPTSQRPMTPDAGYGGPKNRSNDIPPVPVPLAFPPERRRPPMPPTGESGQRGLNSNESFVPAPLVSPGMRREELRPSTRGSDRSQSQTRPREEVKVEPPPVLVSDASVSEASINDASQIPLVETNNDRALPLNLSTGRTEPPTLESDIMTQPTETASKEKPDEEEVSRPGLGPMIKKKDAKSTFLAAAKAASAFGAFKPRAGGAAERLRIAQLKPSEGPDGISSVVPAPSLLRVMSDESVKSATLTLSEEKTAIMTTPKPIDNIPEVKITVPESNRPSSIQGPVKALQEPVVEQPKIREIKRQRPPAEIMSKEIRAIGIDPAIIGDRGGELLAAWEEYGFTPGEGMRNINVDQMQERIKNDLDKLQTGSEFLKFMDDQDEKVAAIHRGFDEAIAECDELDGLLTLYLVELDTLAPDIAFIEAQSQGLQVMASNQKLLQAELKSLLETISLSSEQLACLHEAPLDSPRGLEVIETALVGLYKAMLTIDPSLGLSGTRSNEGSLRSGQPEGYGNSEIGSMRVLQEKKEVYKNECAKFLGRLRNFLQIQFGVAIDETRKALEKEKGGKLTRSGKVKLDPRNHDLSRALLWKFSPLMLFSREVNRSEWEDLIKTYESVCKGLYQDEFREAVFAWKRIARKPTGDEGDILFTAQAEKQTEGIATTARKLTVKRSQTLAKSLRSPIGENSSKNNADKVPDGRLHPYEVFAGALDEMVPIISMEQNFIVDFFHVTSLEQHDFPDTVALFLPESRRGGDLKRPKVMDPNRELARLVVQSMDDIYSFFPTDIQALVDWSLQADPMQGVGVIAAIERKLVEFEETNQEYLARTLQRVHARLATLFNKFLDEQIRAIEETKVKIKKRKGVIAFIRIFPSFSTALETMLASSDDLEIRQTVNKAYVRINKAMFESLKVIARENPSAQTAGADPEDKEALNYQILLIENMSHYLEEVDARSNTVLEDWKHNALQEMEEHMGLYIGAVIRRPLGKLLDTLESTESLMSSRQPGDSFLKIAAMPSHSKSTFTKVLASHDSKEIRKGIDALKRRVEKHFGDADDLGSSRVLVSKVLLSCEKFYEKVEDRILTISRDVYDGEPVAEWTRQDVSQAFKKDTR